MTQKSIKIFVDETYSKPPKKIYASNKTDVYHVDGIWSLDMLDLKDYGPKNNGRYRYVLVVIDNLSKYCFTTRLKNKNGQTITNSFQNIVINSKRKPNLIESDRSEAFYKSTFQKILKNNNIKHFSRNISLGAVFAERFNRLIKNLLTKPVFQAGTSNWVDVLPTITEKYNNRRYSSTKLTPVQASLKKNEGYIYKSLLDKRKKMNSKFQVNDLARKADLKGTFSKRDATNWSYKLYKVTEIGIDAIPSYRIDNSGERYNESFLKKTELTIKENKDVMKALNLK